MQEGPTTKITGLGLSFFTSHVEFLAFYLLITSKDLIKLNMYKSPLIGERDARFVHLIHIFAKPMLLSLRCIYTLEENLLYLEERLSQGNPLLFHRLNLFFLYCKFLLIWFIWYCITDKEYPMHMPLYSHPILQLCSSLMVVDVPFSL